MNPLNLNASPDDKEAYLRAQRNQRLAQMLTQEGQQNIQYDPRGAISPYAGLGKIAAALGGAYFSKKADEDQLNAAKAKQDQLNKMFGVGSTASAGQPTPQQLAGALNQSQPQQAPQNNMFVPKGMAPEQAVWLLQNQPDTYNKLFVQNNELTPEQKNAAAGGVSMADLQQANLAKTRAEALRTVNAGDTAIDYANGGKQFIAPKLINFDNGGQQVFGAQGGNGEFIPQSQVNKSLTPGEAQAGLGVTYQPDANGNIVALPNKLAPGVAPQAIPVTAADGEPLTAKPAPLTESQGNAALFGARALESDKIINAIGNNYNTVGLNAKKAVENIPGVGSLANSMLTDSQQQIDQAHRDFVNAVLRKESGASISPSEFANAQKQYFPQPGDSEAVIKQKSANRQTAIQGLNIMSGSGAAQMQAAHNSAPQEKTGGVLHVDAHGNKAIVYPDGTYKEVQ